MNEYYIIPLLLAAAMALSACKDDKKEVAPHPETPFPTIAVLPAIPPASVPAPVASEPASAPAKIDLLVFDKLHSDCLKDTYKNKLTPTQCREQAWKDAQK